MALLKPKLHATADLFEFPRLDHAARTATELVFRAMASRVRTGVRIRVITAMISSCATRVRNTMTSISPISRLRSLRVIDVMNRNVVKVSAQQPMSEVAREFLDHDISAAPVVDEFDCCVGVISATDFLQRDCATDKPVVRPMNRTGHGDADGETGNNSAGIADDIVRFHMTQTVRTIHPQALLLNAAIVMNAEHIHRLPVVDESNHVVGMISTMDVVAAVVNSVDEVGLLALVRDA